MQFPFAIIVGPHRAAFAAASYAKCALKFCLFNLLGFSLAAAGKRRGYSLNYTFTALAPCPCMKQVQFVLCVAFLKKLILVRFLFFQLCQAGG